MSQYKVENAECKMMIRVFILHSALRIYCGGAGNALLGSTFGPIS